MTLSKAASLISFLALWGCSADQGPGESSDPVVPQTFLVSAEARSLGATLFARHCALCHGERGAGDGKRRLLSTPAADLTDPYWQARTAPESIFLTIREGRPRTPMAAWKFLSDEETWSLVAYILTLSDESD